MVPPICTTARCGAGVLQLLAREDEALLVGGDALLVLDLGLDSVDGVGGLDFKSDGLAGKGLNENLHFILRVVDCCWRQVAFWACVVISAAVAPPPSRALARSHLSHRICGCRR